MEKLVEQGLCKAIGISNFTTKKTKALLEAAKIVPACNQGIYKLNISTIVALMCYFPCSVWVS